MIFNIESPRAMRLAVLLVAALAAPCIHAQNLVPNPSFEEVADGTKEKDIKSFGLVDDVTLNWSGATDVSPDLFMVREKESKVTAPCNDYGHQDPQKGSFYAGFRAYSKSPKLKRSYLQVKLTEKLVKNQQYCVSFDLSLADLSRYAVPDIGAILSDRKIERGGTAPIVQKPDVQHKSNKSMVYMDGWETVCGTFTGTGEEEYLILGCFGGDASIEEEKVARPNRFNWQNFQPMCEPGHDEPCPNGWTGMGAPNKASCISGAPDFAHGKGACDDDVDDGDGDGDGDP